MREREMERRRASVEIRELKKTKKIPLDIKKFSTKVLKQIYTEIKKKCSLYS